MRVRDKSVDVQRLIGQAEVVHARRVEQISRLSLISAQTLLEEELQRHCKAIVCLSRRLKQALEAEEEALLFENKLLSKIEARERRFAGKYAAWKFNGPTLTAADIAWSQQ